MFETNDKDIIRREVTDYIEGMKARGARLVFASDHSISTNTRYRPDRYRSGRSFRRHSRAVGANRTGLEEPVLGELGSGRLPSTACFTAVRPIAMVIAPE